MNNIKRLFLGIAAIALTLSFSAFKEVKTVSKSSKFANVYYGWSNDDAEYQRISGTPNQALCISDTDETCAIVINSSNPNPPSTLTSQEAQDADALPYNDSDKGYYFP